MHVLLVIDGAAFSLIGLVVLLTPSPQPALVVPVDEAVALAPFKETRRLLASQFLGNGLLGLVLGLTPAPAQLVRWAVLARLVTIGVVLAINAAQLRAGHWKRAPLVVIVTVLASLGLAYGVCMARCEVW